MKRIYFIIISLLISIASFSQYYSHPQQVVIKRHSQPVYYNTSAQQSVNEPRQIGIITRFGYSFADYFAYGASIYYKFNPRFGIAFGVDGASKVSFKNAENIEDAYKQTVGNISQWDIRAGIMVGKYFGFGGIYGNCKVCTNANKNTLDAAAFKHHHNNNIHDYGGYITFLFPFCDWVGLDVDLAYTTHTYFTISGGIVLSIPLKK